MKTAFYSIFNVIALYLFIRHILILSKREVGELYFEPAGLGWAIIIFFAITAGLVFLIPTMLLSAKDLLGKETIPKYPAFTFVNCSLFITYVFYIEIETGITSAILSDWLSRKFPNIF